MFKALLPSQRNCRFILPVSGKIRVTARSTSRRPGASRILRPELPSTGRPETIGFSLKAAVLNRGLPLTIFNGVDASRRWPRCRPSRS